jgi:acyl-CoA reductase-like NAD-dependent aldehyde dehydrogenase
VALKTSRPAPLTEKRWWSRAGPGCGTGAARDIHEKQTPRGEVTVLVQCSDRARVHEELMRHQAVTSTGSTPVLALISWDEQF